MPARSLRCVDCVRKATRYQYRRAEGSLSDYVKDFAIETLASTIAESDLALF